MAASRQLRRTIILIGVPLAVAAVGMLTFLANRGMSSQLEREAFAQLREVVLRASRSASQYLRDRQRDVILLSRVPDVIEIGLAASREAERLGLQRATDAVRRRRAGSRQISRVATVRTFLGRALDESDFALISIADRYGLHVVGTDPEPELVVADDTFWREALSAGVYQGVPAYDEAAGTIALDIAAAIADRPGRPPQGVIRATLPLTRLANLLATSDRTGGVRVEVVDSAGRVVISRDTAQLLRPTAGAGSIPLSPRDTVVTIQRSGQTELVASTPTSSGLWWVLARQPADEAYAAARSVQRTLYFASGLLLTLMFGLLIVLAGWLDRRVTHPVRVAGAITRRVADGDLAVNVRVQDAGVGEAARLLTSVQQMLVALRTLVGAIRNASEESAAMSEQISASTQEMSASTEEMARTCQALSGRVNEQADLVNRGSEDANRILSISTQLAVGAQAAAERNTALRNAAEGHRSKLLEGSEHLTQLAREIELGAEEAKALASMSAEIQSFVGQAQTIAKRTNMLALNAAIEAARASGAETRGFAVVADEVRKLAAQAAQAATTTSETVHQVLSTVGATRERLDRLATGSASVREVAESAARGLQEVADAAAESSAWTDEISNAAGEVRHLVEEITERLRTISEGTSSFVESVEGIAASSEEQSASTQEIAQSAGQLAGAAEKLTAAIANFRLNERERAL